MITDLTNGFELEQQISDINSDKEDNGPNKDNLILPEYNKENFLEALKNYRSGEVEARGGRTSILHVNYNMFMQNELPAEEMRHNEIVSSFQVAIEMYKHAAELSNQDLHLLKRAV